MRVLIRADASLELGTGHAMRCLTLARGLRSQGAEVLFASTPLPGNINHVIRAANFALTEAMPEHGSWEWLIVDHYGLGWEFERAYRRVASRILAVDDLANRRHDCDLLLDQNLYPAMERRYDSFVPASTRQLLGPTYALLREEFAAVRALGRNREKLSRILVFFGGSDPTDETSKALGALAVASLADVRIDVVVGAANPRWQALEELARGIPGCCLRASTDHMARLMAETDLFVGAGGSTSWERCCLGVPSLVISVADNQVAICEALAEGGYVTYLGTHGMVTTDALALEIRRAAEDFRPYAAAGSRGRALVDGQGARRVIEAMEAMGATEPMEGS